MKGQDALLLALVSNAPEKLTKELGEGLKEIGFVHIRCLTPQQTLHQVFAPREILVADFVSISSEPRFESRLDSSLDQFTLILPKDRPILGLFPAGEVESPSTRTLICREIVAWPGDSAEVMAKVKRLYHHMTVDRRLERTLTLKLNLIGESAVFHRVINDIGKYSKCDAPVLVLGETGTGKEQVARAIHYFSADEDKPFVAVNCGALPDNLIENELFGHVKGAYTDAKESQRGLIEQAEGGTLFLDEIETLSLKGQVALLRFLQDYEYRPLGSQRSKKATLRLITASNEPLEQRVGDGNFRKDLFYRLNILSLHLPPLRERERDVTLLAEHFVDKYRELYRQYDKYLDPGTLEWITRYDWPGNVRELENLILREFLLAESARIVINPLTGTTGERRRNALDRRYGQLFRRDFQDAKAMVVSEFERSYLQYMLEEANGNISEAARQAGKERRTFAKLLDKHGIGKRP